MCLCHLILATPIWDRHACPHFPDEKLRYREKKQPAHRCRASGWQICDLNPALELSYELKLPLTYLLGNCWFWLSQGQTLLPVKLCAKMMILRGSQQIHASNFGPCPREKAGVEEMTSHPSDGSGSVYIQ